MTDREPAQDEAIQKIANIIESNLSLHSIRGGEAVYLIAHSPLNIARQILSMLEPVELAELGDEEVMSIVKEVYPHTIPGGVFNLITRIIPTTIQHNQNKGQLFRLRSEKI